MSDSDPYAEVQRLIREGQPKTALPLAEKCTVQHPQSAKAWAQLGQVLVLLQQMPAARLALDKALALDPHLTTAVMAMAAVCLEQGHDAQAIEFLRKSMADPQLPWAMWLRSAHHMMQALVRCGLLEQARLCLQAVQDKLTTMGAAAPEWLASSQWRLATCWWEPRQTARMRIRRAMPDDAAWLKQSFANTGFGDAVNRDYAQRLKRTELTQLAAQLAQQYRLPPADQGAMLWLIERHDQQPAKVLGLASFTNIDSNNLRAEFIIGFPGARPAGGLVLEASALLADFAFNKSGACFHKVCASVYADNPRASDLLDILVRVGFRQEGVLREQVKLASGNYVDLKVLGGIRAEVTGNPAMQQITRRYLGRVLL